MCADRRTRHPAARARLLLLAALLAAIPGALAQSGGSFAIQPSHFPSAGGTSSGGAFALSGSISPAATAMTSGAFKLEPGFWPATLVPAGATGDTLFTDSFE